MAQVTRATTLDLSEGNVLGIRLQGRLQEQDYSEILPEMARIIDQHGKLRLLLELKGIQGIEPSALWESLKFDAGQFANYERLAIVGEEEWERVMPALSRPFVQGEVKYFPPAELREAWAWLKGIEPAPGS